jgi:hypothetical protein
MQRRLFDGAAEELGALPFESSEEELTDGLHLRANVGDGITLYAPGTSAPPVEDNVVGPPEIQVWPFYAQSPVIDQVEPPETSTDLFLRQNIANSLTLYEQSSGGISDNNTVEPEPSAWDFNTSDPLISNFLISTELWLRANISSGVTLYGNIAEPSANVVAPGGVDFWLYEQDPSVISFSHNIISSWVSPYIWEFNTDYVHDVRAAGYIVEISADTWTFTPHEPVVAFIEVNWVRPSAEDWLFSPLAPEIKQVTFSGGGGGGALHKQFKQDKPRNLMVDLQFVGQSIDIMLSKDAGPFAPVVRNWADRGNGWYAIELEAVDFDTVGDLVILVATALGTIAIHGEVEESVWDEEVDGSYTARHSLRLANSANAGKTSNFTPGPSTGQIRDVSDTKDRIVAITDAFGNRTALVLDVD